jgi:hypothetical protein
LEGHCLSRSSAYQWVRIVNSRYKSKNDADEAVSGVSLTSSSGGYINGRNSANLELLIDKTSSIYLNVQGVGIPMGTNCAPLLADLFLYSYESEFLRKLVKDKKIHEARAFNFTFRYIDDVLSINNSRFATPAY